MFSTWLLRLKTSLAKILKNEALMKTIITAAAIVCICVLTIVAVKAGLNGGTVYAGMSLIAGLGGYAVNRLPPGSK